MPPVSLAILSWRAHATLRNSLESYERGGILPLFAERLLFFNEISDLDDRIAADFGFKAMGSDRNLGIFGAISELIRAATSEFVLLLENDLVLIESSAVFQRALAGALVDMIEHNIPYFSMRSRRQPGEPFWRRSRYEKHFRVVEPLGGSTRHDPAAPYWRWSNLLENYWRPGLRACAIYAEERPDRRHPRIIARSRHGHWLTSSRFLSWSNCGILVNRVFVRDVVLERVRRFPSTETLNGQQDIEAALKSRNWWRRQRVGMGQADPGPFTHVRLDR